MTDRVHARLLILAVLVMSKYKLTDAMQEASETQCWLEFSFACGYIDEKTFQELDKEYEEIISMLNSMEMVADKFCF